MTESGWQFEMIRPGWLAALVVAVPLAVYYWRRSLIAFGPTQRLVSLVVRVLLIALLATALSDLRIITQTDRQFVLFAIDESASIGAESRKEARAFVQEAVRHSGEHATAFLTFADRPGEVERTLPSESRNARPGTAIDEAILAAQLAIPATHVPRIVLLTDGNETTGDARAAAEATSIPITTVPLPGRPKREVWISAVRHPGQVRPGESFVVEVIVGSTHDDQGTLRLSRGSAAVVETESAVHEGENLLRIESSLVDVREAKYNVRLVGFDDELKQNNRAEITVRVSAKPRVLLIADEGDAAAHLGPALQSQLIEVRTISPDNAPSDAAELDAFDAVMLCNVPAAALSEDCVGALEEYVVRGGGGLVVVGGDQSLTPGGYRGTKLEQLLPVTCEPRPDRPKPSLAMVLVIDQSFSMREGGRIDLAKRATRQVIETLDPADQIGVMAFEEKSRWISPLALCDDKPQLLREIATIEAAGGTNMYPAMEKAYLALDESFADLKHMIVLSDGISHPGPFDNLARKLADSGITVSTVAVGDEAAADLLADIARLGGGNFYDCRDPDDVPEVFTTETAIAGRLGIDERPFPLRVVDPARVFSDFDPASAPALLGYVETRGKPTTHIILATDDGQPLLARWRLGSGTVLTFTSDAEDRWAAAWLRWDGFSTFWSQTVRHAMRPLPADAETDMVEVAPDYHAEFHIRPTADVLLREIASVTGGHYVPKPADVFAATDRTIPHTFYCWSWLLSAAVLLFVFDVVLKRVDMRRHLETGAKKKWNHR